MFYKYKKIDVLVCKSSKYVPFYLVKKYDGAFDHQIYTRVCDTNTPKTGQANYSDVEKLWRIHFQREDEKKRTLIFVYWQRSNTPSFYLNK